MPGKWLFIFNIVNVSEHYLFVRNILLWILWLISPNFSTGFANRLLLQDMDPALMPQEDSCRDVAVYTPVNQASD